MKSIFDTLKGEDFDYKNVYERFVGEKDLFATCLDDFLTDDEILKLNEAIEVKNYNDSFLIAHSLKGVSANLGLNKIYALFCDLTDDLRNQKYINLDKKVATINKEIQLLKNIVAKAK